MRSILLTVVAVFSLSLLLLGQAANSGNVAAWSNQERASTDGSGIRYNTKSVVPSQMTEKIQSSYNDYDMKVVLSMANERGSTSQRMASLAPISAAIKASQQADVMSNVYHSNIENRKALLEHLLSSEMLKEAQKVDLSEVIERIQSVPKDNSRHSFHVAVDTEDAEHHVQLKKLFDAARAQPHRKVAFVAVDEPSEGVVLPEQSGEYHRLLSSSAAPKPRTSSSSSTTAPATGAEFSIYYEGTYLYITPDLFTGIMTALFMFFVALTGLRCMGTIQGMSAFYDRVPSNGKEA